MSKMMSGTTRSQVAVWMKSEPVTAGLEGGPEIGNHQLVDPGSPVGLDRLPQLAGSSDQPGLQTEAVAQPGRLGLVVADA